MKRSIAETREPIIPSKAETRAPTRVKDKRRRRRDLEGNAVRYIFFLCALVSIVTTVGIVISLLSQAVGFFQEVPFWEFFFGTRWTPILKPNSYGVLPLVGGTLLVAGLALAVAIPVGLAIAIFLAEYAPDNLRRVIKPALEYWRGSRRRIRLFFALTCLIPKIRTYSPHASSTP